MTKARALLGEPSQNSHLVDELYAHSGFTLNRKTGKISLFELFMADSPTYSLSDSSREFNRETSDTTRKFKCSETTHDSSESTHDTCSCGFYGFKSLDIARKYYYPNKHFISKVSVSGKTVEHELGSRYERQTVKEVLVSTCYMCDQPADRVFVLPWLGNEGQRNTIYPLCAEDAKTVRSTHVMMSFEEFGEILSLSSPEGGTIAVSSEFSEVTPWQSSRPSARFKKAAPLLTSIRLTALRVPPKVALDGFLMALLGVSTIALIVMFVRSFLEIQALVESL